MAIFFCGVSALMIWKSYDELIVENFPSPCKREEEIFKHDNAKG
jgi:hypothetical protein